MPGTADGEFHVGQLRRQVRLGTAALYRVRSWDAKFVYVEVVQASGLKPGSTFKFARSAVATMDVVDAIDVAPVQDPVSAVTAFPRPQ